MKFLIDRLSRLVVLLAICYFTINLLPSFATPYPTSEESFKGEINLIYNKKEVKLTAEPIFYSGSIFIPAKDLATIFGMYHTIPDRRYLMFYKSNRYMKLDLETPTGFINGKSYPVSAAPFIFEEKYFVPVDFFCKAFDLESHWNEKIGRYEINSDTISERYAFSNQEAFFKKVFIDEAGVSISIPLHWDRLDKVKRSYGLIDDFEHFAISIEHHKLEGINSLEKFEDSYRKTLLKDKAASLQFQKVNKNTKTKVNSYALYFLNKESKQKLSQVIYLYYKDKIGYIVTFTYNDTIDPGSAQTIMDAITDSFQINHLTIDEREEHYVEYTNFFNSGMTLDTPLHSNQTFSNYFLLKGTLSSGPTSLRVIVSKDMQSIEFLVPVKNKRFDKKIYLPFGLGKHNIYVEAVDTGFFTRNSKDPDFEPLITYDNDNLLELSVLNISSKSIRYLIPTSRIPSDDPAITDVANLMTYKETGQFKKARALYLYITKNYVYDKENKDYETPVLKVIKDEEGTEEELAYLYASLLRGIDIPARVVKGELDSETHYWNEVLINGKWTVSDLGSEYLKGDGITAYFNLAKNTYYESYRNIKILDY